MKITIEMMDGSSLASEASDRTWMCLADRVKFHEQFGVSPAAMAEWQSMTDADGNLNPESDLSSLREDYVLFFAWRELSRQREDVPTFEALLDQAVECEIEAGGPPTSGRTATPSAS